MEKVILKAIEGGLREGSKWKFVTANTYWVTWLDGNGKPTNISVNDYLLDKTFWECLGRAMSWVNNSRKGEWKSVSDELSSILILPENSWIIMWHKFIDHRIEGKLVDSFFEELMK